MTNKYDFIKNEDGFIDYEMTWTLLDEETGHIWEEKYDPISLNDFEVIYGNNSYRIISVVMVVKI